jgi:hypothetical protein
LRVPLAGELSPLPTANRGEGHKETEMQQIAQSLQATQTALFGFAASFLLVAGLAMWRAWK